MLGCVSLTSLWLTSIVKQLNVSCAMPSYFPFESQHRVFTTKFFSLRQDESFLKFYAQHLRDATLLLAPIIGFASLLVHELIHDEWPLLFSELVVLLF